MPDYFSHAIGATLIYRQLNHKQQNAIANLPLFYLGAQGGDLFFFYQLSWGKGNLGRKLHSLSPTTLFQNLQKGNPSYLYGFACHYALDCNVHPAIYANQQRKGSTWEHLRWESDLGILVSKRYHLPRQILRREEVLSALYPVYDSVRHLYPELNLQRLQTCLKRHSTYTEKLFATKSDRLHEGTPYDKLLPTFEEGIDFGKRLLVAMQQGEFFHLLEKNFLAK